MEMLEHDYVIGGENSGHVINLDYLHTGDGIITSIVLCNIMAKTSKTLEELTSSLTIYPESLVNLKVKDTFIPCALRLLIIPKLDILVSTTVLFFSFPSLNNSLAII